MIRRYCDICGCELTDDTAFEHGKKTSGSHFANGLRLSFRIVVAVNSIWGSGDLCKACVYEAIASNAPEASHE